MLLAGAIACLAGGLSQVRGALSTLDRLRAAVAALRNGAKSRIDGPYPAEVQPMVDELNAFLEHRERTTGRAVSKAGDLAHGLKTPLAILSLEADRAAASGHDDVAAAISQQVEKMRRQVDYHLAQARASASGATAGTRTVLLTSADGLSRTLQRLHTGRGVAIDIDVPASHAVRVQREDLDEILGNLLDNACKWAAGRVRLSSRIGGDRLEIFVEDDGPGIAEGLRTEVLRRGVRADEALPGSGLGLAIVRELVELYDGSLDLGQSSLGGLSVRITLPRA